MSTAIYMQEKSPLLPVNTEEECPRIECYKNKVYKKKYRRQAWMFVFLGLIFFLQNDYHNRVYNDLKHRYGYGNNNEGDVNSYLSIENVADADDIALYNENQVSLMQITRTHFNSNKDNLSRWHVSLNP